jgi:serine protease inhibitor
VADSHGPTVSVDRPFLFFIVDKPTGSILSLGRVLDPR